MHSSTVSVAVVGWAGAGTGGGATGGSTLVVGRVVETVEAVETARIVVVLATVVVEVERVVGGARGTEKTVRFTQCSTGRYPMEVRFAK